mmetsp:Transcript_18347/g.27185  ORF Transcript_18347/g.27185 Transcript_18347/m.27185 type:complete len:148 (-) Transcript_18347:213-656(-)
MKSLAIGLTYEDEIRAVLGQCMNCTTKDDSNDSDRSTELVDDVKHEHESKRRISKIQVIDHVMICKSPACTSPTCSKMKSYLSHGKTCKVKYSGGCKICTRIWAMLRIHALECEDPYCRIPQCNAIRLKIKEFAIDEDMEDMLSICL